MKKQAIKKQNPSLLTSVKRHKNFVFGFTILCTTAAYLSFQTIPTLYKTQAKLVFEDRDYAYLNTQKAILLSSPVLDVVSATYPTQQKSNVFKTLNLFPDDQSSDTQSALSQKLSGSTDYLRQKIHITIEPNTSILDITFIDHRDQYGIDILYLLIKTYLKKTALTQGGLDNTETLVLLQKNLNQAQDDLTAFESALDEITSERIPQEAQKNLDVLERTLMPFKDKKGEFVYNSQAPEILKSPLIQSLTLQHGVLEKEHKTLSKRYGPKHPKMKQVLSDMQLVQNQIDHEWRNIFKRLKTEYDAAKTIIDTKKNQSQTNIEAQNKQHELLQERVKQAETLLNEYKDKTSDVSETPVKILTAPNSAQAVQISQPLFVALSCVIAFLLSSLIAMIMEARRKTFLCGREVKDRIGVPCLALIPNVKADKLLEFPLNEPQSQCAEGIKTLRLKLKNFHTQTTEGHVVTMTSSFKNEGTTTLAIWLARLSAHSGERVVLIDADFHNADLHEQIGLSNTATLGDILSGQKSFKDIVQIDKPSGMHVICNRVTPSNAYGLLTGKNMRTLINDLKQDYDLIILNNCGSLSSSDSLATASYADTLLYTIQWDKTPDKIVHNEISKFSEIKTLGIAGVLTKIDLKKHTEYGFGAVIEVVEA